jgi:hypothetical protein
MQTISNVATVMMRPFCCIPCTTYQELQRCKVLTPSASMTCGVKCALLIAACASFPTRCRQLREISLPFLCCCCCCCCSRVWCPWQQGRLWAHVLRRPGGATRAAAGRAAVSTTATGHSTCMALLLLLGGRGREGAIHCNCVLAGYTTPHLLKVLSA